MRRSALRVALPALFLLFAMPGSASAFPLSTCTLSIASTDASGGDLDTAQSGAADSTQSDPFKVDWDGEVGYDGSTEAVIKNYTYSVSVFGVPTPIRGGDTNDDENTDGSGSVGVAANAPFRVAGLYYVSGEYKGEGGSCVGSGWFQLQGSPVGTIPWIAGIVLVVLGALGLVAGARGHTITSVIGGIALGVGVDLLAISHSVLPLGENTPLAGVGIGAALGLIIGLLGRRGKGETGGSGEAPPAPTDAPPPPEPIEA